LPENSSFRRITDFSIRLDGGTQLFAEIRKRRSADLFPSRPCNIAGSRPCFSRWHGPRGNFNVDDGNAWTSTRPTPVRRSVSDRQVLPERHQSGSLTISGTATGEHRHATSAKRDFSGYAFPRCYTGLVQQLPPRRALQCRRWSGSATTRPGQSFSDVPDVERFSGAGNPHVCFGGRRRLDAIKAARTSA